MQRTVLSELKVRAAEMMEWPEAVGGLKLREREGSATLSRTSEAPAAHFLCIGEGW